VVSTKIKESFGGAKPKSKPPPAAPTKAGKSLGGGGICLRCSNITCGLAVVVDRQVVAGIYDPNIQ
jgi:hypothetical protein